MAGDVPGKRADTLRVRPAIVSIERLRQTRRGSVDDPDVLALRLVLAQVPGRGLARIDGDIVRWKSLPSGTAAPLDAGFANG
jgi:hypothetical protein